MSLDSVLSRLSVGVLYQTLTSILATISVTVALEGRSIYDGMRSTLTSLSMDTQRVDVVQSWIETHAGMVIGVAVTLLLVTLILGGGDGVLLRRTHITGVFAATTLVAATGLPWLWSVVVAAVGARAVFDWCTLGAEAAGKTATAWVLAVVVVPIVAVAWILVGTSRAARSAGASAVGPVA